MRTIEVSDEAYKILVRFHGDVSAFVERLAAEAEEVAAVKEGVDAYRAGDHEPWQQFSERFMAERGIAPDQEHMR